MSGWDTKDIPDQAGRTAVVTGANSGIGLVAARELARAGADVVLACRDADRGESAAERIGDEVPGARVQVRVLDLADLASVRAFPSSLPHATLDLLVNNAGVMATPRRQTADGFELQLGTNHLGHFALTGLLLERLRAGTSPRVVTLASGAHRMGRIDFDDLQGERSYSRWSRYGQSKLANLLFAFELQRRADDAGLDLRSMAAHPGYAATNLQTAGPAMGAPAILVKPLMRIGNLIFAQSDDMGALPTLYAATVPDLPGGTYVGPGGPGEMRGHPQTVGTSDRAQDLEAARRLWEVSEELTGVRFALGAAAV